MFLAALLLFFSDDLSFADALARRGFADFAREIYEQCLQAPSPAVRLAAEYALMDKSSPEAIAEFLGRQPEDDPRRGFVEYDYAEALFQQGRLDEMRKYLDAFLWRHDGTPLMLLAHTLLGRAAARGPLAWRHFALGRDRRAPETSARSVYFETRARIEAGEPKAGARLARDFLRSNPKLAASDIGRAIELEGLLAAGDAAGLEAVMRRHAGTWIEEVAAEYLERILGASRPDIIVSRADRLFADGQYTRAAVKYRAAGLTNAYFCLRLGECYYRLGRLREAAAALLESRKFDGGERIDAGLLRAEILDRLGDPALAEQLAWNQANIPPEKLGLGDARRLLRRGTWKEAAEILERFRDDPEAIHDRAYCLYKMESGEAVAEFERHLKSDDPSERRRTWSYYFIARLAEPARVVDAAAEFRARIAKPDPWLALWIRAYAVAARVDLQDLAAASREFEDLRAEFEREKIGIDPVLHAARRLSRALHEAGDLAAAARQYLLISRLSPDDMRPEFTLTLAEWLFAGKDYERAYELLLQVGSREFHVERMRVECLIALGRPDPAIDRAQAGNLESGGAQELLADAYNAKAASLERGQERTQWLLRARDILGPLSARLRDVPEHSYRLLYKYAETLFELDYDLLDRLFARLDAAGELKFADAGWQEKFRVLRERLRERLPGRK